MDASILIVGSRALLAVRHTGRRAGRFGRLEELTALEHLDVLIVGAGLSGVGAGRYLQAKCPWASYAIFEARNVIGGTWDLFRYPGVRSDSDMFTLGYSFRPWNGEKTIADGASILQYIKDTAAEAEIEARVRFRHRVIQADWSSEEARWTVRAEHTDTAELVEVTCSFIFSCSGYYRYDHGYLPEFPGMDRFPGTVVHPQVWPKNLDYAGKRVVVVGSGATAVTLVPAMATSAGHVTMLQRSPSYIASLPVKDPVVELLRRRLPERWSGPVLRWLKALTTQGFYRLSQRRPEFVKSLLRKGLERQLPAGYDIGTHFTPHYNPWDQRFCVAPDGDFFRAIRRGTVSIVTDRIDTFTENGLSLESGRELEADIIVTATGLELLFIGGIELSVDGEPVDLPNRLIYKGAMVEGVPNLAVAVGYTNASWTLKCDLICDYVCRLLNRMRATGMRQSTPINRDGSGPTRPLLNLTSGYVLRSAPRFPKQGSRYPWQVHQSYLRDYRALKLSSVEDGAMVLSNPVRLGAVAAAS
jgi:cation diffusion facilitator CzcD-associated flavoprotein CzcO